MTSKYTVFGVSPDYAMDDAIVAHVMTLWPHAQWADGIIFLPNRRSAASLRQCFLKHLAGKTALLPMMQPLADADPYLLLYSQSTLGFPKPTAIMPALTRRLMLGKQIHAFYAAQGEHCSMRAALSLADALAKLLDDAVAHNLSFSAFSHIVKEDFSEHWARILAFLSIVFKTWPRIEAEQGAISGAQHVHNGLLALATAWQKNPPSIPLLAAGSTGSHPATALLLSAIASAPSGAVLIPAVPVGISVEYEAHVQAGHPLFYVKQLGAIMGETLSDIPIITRPDTASAPSFLLHAFAPAEVMTQGAILATKGLQTLSCANEWEEARAIALLVRQTLETPSRTVMVVSPDRAILQRVSIELERFSVFANNSSACSLLEHPYCQWLRLAMGVISSQAAPLDVLSLLQHDATFSSQPTQKAAFMQAFDMIYARGIDKKTGVQPFLTVLSELSPTHTVAQIFSDALTPLFALAKRTQATLADWLEALISAAEICEVNETFSDDVQTLMATLSAYAPHLIVNASNCDAVLETAFAEPWFDFAQQTHPRVSLHTPIEARMQHADRVILAGLNDGVWPATEHNPWLNTAMQKQLGLPTAAHSLSLQSHDFMALASGTDVVLVRARKQQGSDTKTSRFWQRVMLASDRSATPIPVAASISYITQVLDVPASFAPCNPPMPNPPVALRPRELSITELESLWKNPFAIYARHVLGLKPLDGIADTVDMRWFGTLAHRILEKILTQNALHDAALKASIIESTLKQHLPSATLQLLWRPRLEKCVVFFEAEHTKRQSMLTQVSSEELLTYSLNCPSGIIALKGKADRVEDLKTGEVVVADFKAMSQAPSNKQVSKGELPQLPFYYLAAMEKRKKSLSDLPDNTAHCAYWWLPSVTQSGEVLDVVMSFDDISRIIAQYITLMEHQLFSATPFLYSPHGNANYATPFDALARVGEWTNAE